MNKWTKTPIIQKNAGSTSLLVMYTSSDSVSASSQIVTGSIKVWSSCIPLTVESIQKCLPSIVIGSIKVWSSVLHSSYSSFDSKGWRKNSKETVWVVCMNLEGNMQIIKYFGLQLYCKKKKKKAGAKIPSVQHLQARAFQLLHPHLQLIPPQYKFFGGLREPIYANFVQLLEN